MVTVPFDARMVHRGDAGYEVLRRVAVWNRRVPPRYPEAIVVARSVDDVVDAVALARERGLRVSVRSRGHDWAGGALRDASLLLDVSNLYGLRIGGADAEVGPGLTGGDLTAALAARGLGFPAGHCRDVGLGGYLLAGGMGWNAGVWGPACHSVVEVEVVTADGRVRRVDDGCDDGSLWSARGAGPGYAGIVTRFRLRVYRAPRAVVTSTFVFPIQDLPTVGEWVAELAQSLDRRIELSLFLTTAPSSIGELGVEAGRHVVIVTATAFAGSHSACGTLLGPLERGTGRRGYVESEARRETPHQALYEVTGRRLPAGRRFAVDCLWTDDEPATVLETIGAALRAAPSPSSSFLLNVAPAQPPAVAPPPAALSTRGRLYVSTYAVWDDEHDDARNATWLRGAQDALAPAASGRYVGEADLFAAPGRARECYSQAAWTRLLEVRRRLDPDGLFCGFPEGHETLS